MTRRSYGWVFAVLGLAAAGGCGSTVVDGTSGSTSGMTSGGGGAAPECPKLLPKDGSACESDGEACKYPLHCNSEDTATCKGGHWVVAMGGCSCEGPCCPDSCPPMFQCPTDVPTAGESCGSGPIVGGDCSYTTQNACGQTQKLDFQCEGTWVLNSSSGGDCSATAACRVRSQSDCATDGTCQWFEPGCVGGTSPNPPLPEAGCYPVGDCSATPDLCAPMQEQCTIFVIDPCFDKGCDACAASVSLCALVN